ncbi:heat shock factor-binding protein [Aristolochia californica]|uniref:heat shock factor-binding protein n=1 Tax=Aristolochia californica TaxID=171875 RepID=UPI0035DD50F5
MFQTFFVSSQIGAFFGLHTRYSLITLRRFTVGPLLAFRLDSSGTQIRLLRAKMDGHDEDPKQSAADMTAFVQNLLQQMQSRFQAMSDNIVAKIDEMGGRIDELEQSINDLKAEMGESSPSPVAATKPKSDEPSDGST